MSKYIYNRNGDRIGYVDDQGNRFDNCGNFVSRRDFQGYGYNRNGDRTSWYDRNSRYTYNNGGNRTLYTDHNGRTWNNSGNYRGHKSHY